METQKAQKLELNRKALGNSASEVTVRIGLLSNDQLNVIVGGVKKGGKGNWTE